jgi:phage/plasmid primase-like uncharacterized protein
MNAEKYAAYRAARAILIEYLQLKVAEADWHGVSDAANELRVMEARHEVDNKIIGVT